MRKIPRRYENRLSEINEGIILTDKNGFIIQINKYLEEKEFSQGDWIQKFYRSRLSMISIKQV